jgi:hypothetical protein
MRQAHRIRDPGQPTNPHRERESLAKSRLFSTLFYKEPLLSSYLFERLLFTVTVNRRRHHGQENRKFSLTRMRSPPRYDDPNGNYCIYNAIFTFGIILSSRHYEKSFDSCLAVGKQFEIDL